MSSPAPSPKVEEPPLSQTPDSTAPFNPLFTLLSTANQTHHPSVHYVFDDDPPDALTSAALESLSPTDSSSKERYIVVDLDSTGTKVISAKSMSPEWAVTSAELGKAPTWGEDAEEKDGGNMMLKIEGVEAAKGSLKDKAKEADLEELVERYQKGLEGLRRVVASVGM